jgi:hypothetical protein
MRERLQDRAAASPGRRALNGYSAAFTMAVYVHTNPEDLAAGRDALAAIYRAEEAR